MRTDSLIAGAFRRVPHIHRATSQHTGIHLGLLPP